MHFDLNEEQRQIEASLDSFLTKLLPVSTLVKQVEDRTFDTQLYSGLAELGLIGVLAPESVGGLEMDLLTLSVISERLGFHAAPAPIVENALSAFLLADARPDIAAGIISGEKIVGITLAATHQPNQIALSNVIWPDQCTHLLTPSDAESWQLIEVQTAPIEKIDKNSLDLTRPLADYEGQFESAETFTVPNCRVSRVYDALKILYAMDAYGAGVRCAEMAIEYAKERSQFDQKIGAFQGLKYQLTDMMCEQLPSRFLGWIAAHKWDLVDPDAERLAALAKSHLSDVAVRSGRRSVECHGGIGYTWEYPLHLFLKRAMFDRAILGLPQVQRTQIAQLDGWAAS